jgi:YVTN family beta-propeller protein
MKQISKIWRITSPACAKARQRHLHRPALHPHGNDAALAYRGIAAKPVCLRLVPQRTFRVAFPREAISLICTEQRPSAQSSALAIAVLIVLRLICRLSHKQPPLPDTLPRWQQRAAATNKEVYVIDAVDNKLIPHIGTGQRANGVTVRPDGSRVYVSDGGDSVSVIDTTDNKIVAAIPVGRRPWSMAITPDSKKLYMANGRPNSVSVIDTVQNVEVRDVNAGKLPWTSSSSNLAPGEPAASSPCRIIVGFASIIHRLLPGLKETHHGYCQTQEKEPPPRVRP